MKAYTKDVIRSIAKGKKRFFALMLITALGVCMLVGLTAGCDDLRYTADDFFDKQNLYDISIVSTMGLTKEDVDTIESLPQVDAVEGTYSETVYTEVDGAKRQVTLNTLSKVGINQPYLLEGEMPDMATEILVTEKFINESGKNIGDLIYIEEDDRDEEDEINFIYKGYRISGIVIDVLNINSVEGAVAFRDNSTTDYTFFVRPDAVKSDIFTAMYLTLVDTDEMLCYSDEYVEAVDEVVSILEEEIKEDREQARYDKITSEAWDEVADAEDEMWEAFAEAEAEISKAQKEIEDAKAELLNGETELTEAERELTKAERELLQAERELERGESQIVAAEAELSDAETQLSMLDMLVTEAESVLDMMESILSEFESGNGENGGDTSDNNDETDSGSEGDDTDTSWPDIEIPGVDNGTGSNQTSDLRQQIAEKRAEIQAYRNTINSGKAELAAGKAEIAAAKAELEKGWEGVNEGWEELEKGEQKIYDGWDELADARIQLEDGQSELDQNVAEYEAEKSDALQELADAKQEISDLKMTEWYISTRTALSGYANIKSDAECIEAIGKAFPVIFLTIAILISLTTMSRMVEEDRGLIGTYKALGFSDDEIRRKYVVYALLACILGGILGNILGFVGLPEIMFIVFGVMYQLPVYVLCYNWGLGLLGIALFIVGVVGASILSCDSVLKSMPATLMRAKPPSSGSRVLLERITPIWSKLSFLNKVTARNLFRYKKRLFMTIFGIAGCTALLLAGYTIKDTVSELIYLQYDDAYRYDAMVVAEDNDKLLEQIEDNRIVRKYMNTLITNVKVIGESGKEETVQLIVVPEGENIASYIRLKNEEGERLKLTDDDIFITINLSKILDFAEEDFVTIQTLNLDQAEVEVTEIVMNYLGNCVYMTQKQYEDCFGTFEPNGALLLLKEEGQDAFIETLEDTDGILSVVSVKNLKDGFGPAFQIINMVVYVVIVLAAALAFVVLFTLATTNISERERELATIKVLGFYDNEVHLYVNKETLILTSLGILLGLPLGKFLGAWIMSVLNLPSIYFYTTLYPISYLYAAVMAITFAFLVNKMTDRSLDKIDPVEALKSVE